MNRTSLIDAAPAPPGAGAFLQARDPRHLLGLEGLPRETLLGLLDSAARYREHLRTPRWTSDELRGIAVCNAFFEDSTRTRLSFELAEQRLGAIHTTFTVSGSSLSKGETMLDTLKVLTAMHVDLIVVRHRSAGSSAFLARHLEAGVINAGDGEHEHPTQGLLDLLTLSDAWSGRFEGRRLAIVGDIAHSRVARSAIFGTLALGAEVVIAGPATLVPAEAESLGCAVATTVEEALHGADGVIALRLQRERMESGLLASLGEYSRVWGITRERIALMHPGAVVLHPGPMNRGVEIAPDVADGGESRVLRQVENGLAVRCAVLARSAAALTEGS
ncbi:MAG TPA: aspartate carbamoyltransferase catalytic subunit [Candidatus Eisenbacteria bacterium]|jgi:aspartate carbamoyltransferase catalytic subunit